MGPQILWFIDRNFRTLDIILWLGTPSVVFFFGCSIIAVYIPFPRNCALLTPQKGNSMQAPISSRHQNLHHNSQRRGIIIPAYLYAWTPLCTPNRHRGQSSVRSEEDYCHDVKEWQVIMMNSVSHWWLGPTLCFSVTKNI